MTPQTIMSIQNEVFRLHNQVCNCAVHVRKLKLVHKNRAAEYQRMSDEGFPGNWEFFVKPALALEEEADALIVLANKIKDMAQLLRNKPVEEWK